MASHSTLSAAVISEGDVVILRKDKVYKLETVTLQKKVWFEGQNFMLDKVIGCPYNSTFSVSEGELKLSRSIPQLVVPSAAASNDIEVRDNRTLLSEGNNQALSADDIDNLRSEGVEGMDIVQKLVDHSATFSSKTVFAQEKYLKKKAKKHVSYVTILRPTTRVLCELYTQKGQSKILGLRLDTLSQMLSYANVHAGCKVLLTETCSGLLLHAVLERLGPLEAGGRVVHCYHGTAALRPDALARRKTLQDASSFSTASSSWHEQVLEVPLRALTDLKNSGEWRFPGSTASGTAQGDVEDPDAEGQDTSNGSPAPKRAKHTSATLLEVLERKRERVQTACRFLAEERMDCLVVATRFDPVDLTCLLLHFLAPGRPFVVYCPFIEPLVELYSRLKLTSCPTGSTGFLRLTDSWLRAYQVMPERTHPLVTMSGHGGYLLTGFKLLEGAELSQPARDSTIALQDLKEDIETL